MIITDAVFNFFAWYYDNFNEMKIICFCCAFVVVKKFAFFADIISKTNETNSSAILSLLRLIKCISLSYLSLYFSYIMREANQYSKISHWCLVSSMFFPVIQRCSHQWCHKPWLITRSTEESILKFLKHHRCYYMLRVIDRYVNQNHHTFSVEVIHIMTMTRVTKTGFSIVSFAT